jgi:NAD(P)-dependent dehydrogenase (short-subunit alcohol dehydrogenase family)
VVIAGRRREPGERAAAELRASGGRARSVVADVTVESDVERLVQATLNEFGQLDGALNNAGGVNATAPLPGVDAGSWHADLAQNLTSVFYCLK